LEKVFQLFAQVTPGPGQLASGLGIGLFLVRSLIEMHGGTVVAESAGPGQGSTFTVTLPCLPVPAPTPAAAAAGGRAEASSLRVLVVDDNVDAAETLTTFLDMIGAQTRAVYDGPAVVPAALEFRPDVVLLDIGLPGMSGYDVARALRAEPALARAALVALTGWGAEDDRRKAMDAGFDHHLTKPVDLEVLQGVLHSHGPDGIRTAKG
ncbi:MAG TPA: response regulator, partial [Ramlibacter sp.]|uniref:hybrid sensor histidine kinase/response regulator n=1 Tax=Ramlibacter sp. TaxID=1917967 RepID=UPI002D7F21E4